MDDTFQITEVPDIGFPVGKNMEMVREKPEPLPSEPLPDWLSVTPLPEDQTRLVKFPRTREHVKVEEQVFAVVFERVLDEIVSGRSVTEFLRNDPREIDYGRFMRWIRKNPERQARYEEAQEIGTEALLELMDRIAEGVDNTMEDIARSRLRLQQYEFKVKAWNARRYGGQTNVKISGDAKNPVTVALGLFSADDLKKAVRGGPRIVEATSERIA